jgi:hypothetical protein
MVPASWAFRAAGLAGWSSAKQKACYRHPLSPGERARVRGRFLVTRSFIRRSPLILNPAPLGGVKEDGRAVRRRRAGRGSLVQNLRIELV